LYWQFNRTNLTTTPFSTTKLSGKVLGEESLTAANLALAAE
jgi:hypothetical protein